MTEATESAATPFTEDETAMLAALADMVVPASAEYGLPGAADAAILSVILADAARHAERLSAVLAALDDMARQACDAGFLEITDTQRDGVVAAFREARPGDAQLVAALVTQCYYRDDRVVLSLGMELRPPHPDGYAVAQGDWGLLDPVRQRAPFFR